MSNNGKIFLFENTIVTRNMLQNVGFFKKDLQISIKEDQFIQANFHFFKFNFIIRNALVWRLFINSLIKIRHNNKIGDYSTIGSKVLPAELQRDKMNIYENLLLIKNILGRKFLQETNELKQGQCHKMKLLKKQGLEQRSA